MTDNSNTPVPPAKPAKSKEWYEGFRARGELKPGIPPYPLNSQEAADWADGWFDGAL